MSRIVGVMVDNIDAPVTDILKIMFGTLPGTISKQTTIPGCAFGWIGFHAGTGGTGTYRGLQVALDGRILNAAELHTNRDKNGNTLVLLAELYHRHGFTGMLKRLVGDFAIAIYDKAERSLWLGRDRFGVKPMYYTGLPDGGVAFASQPRPLISLDEVPADVNRAFVARFLGLHYRAQDNLPEESPFASVRQLPMAHAVLFHDGKFKSITRYWDLVEQADWDESEDVLAERYRELLMRAVERRIVLTKNPGFTLSGGLDSSSVLCIGSVLQEKPQSAFSSVYVDPTFDERNEIRDVVLNHVSKWVPLELGDEIDLFSIVAEMVRLHDEPVATATWLSHHLLSKEVARIGHESLFGGLGGDELNAGEYEYFPMFFADLKMHDDKETLMREIDLWACYHDHPIHCKSRKIADRMISSMVDLTRPGICLPNLERMFHYAGAVNSEYFDLKTFSPVMDTPFSSYLKNRMYQDMFRETLPCCLRAEDRQCTAQGLEHFDPFLDHELVEFMFRVPHSMKIRNGITKYLLRIAMRGILPEATRSRIKKTGWNAPAHVWFTGDTLNHVRDVVGSHRFRVSGIYNVAEINRIINENEHIIKTGIIKENHMMFLWQLVNLVLWLESLEKEIS